MNIGLFEDAGWQRLLPLTWLRSACELRCGRDRLVDKVRAHLGRKVAAVWTRPELAPVAAARVGVEAAEAAADWCVVNARVLVTADVPPPPPGVAWRTSEALVAAGLRAADRSGLDAALFLDEARLEDWLRSFRTESPPPGLRLITHPWDLIHANAHELVRQCREGGVRDGQIFTGAHLLHPSEIHIAAGAVVKPGVVLDAGSGPIHIAEDAVIQPNAVLEGPCYVGPQSVVRPGAVLRAGTSLGPVSRVGGEVAATVFQGYANKQHEGYLGHSYIGEWVNLGAATVTSDLKNTYGTIRVFVNGVGVESGRHFIGAIIGDHSKTGIGTLLPTGAVIGVASNVFTRGPVPKFVPSFAWLTDDGLTAYRVDKALDIARTVMARREQELSEPLARLLEHVAQAARTIEAAGWQ